MASDEYREMLISSTQEDLILTDAFSGVHANMLKPSIVKAGLDPELLVKKDKVDFDDMQREMNAKAWRDIWSAGHGVGAINRIESVAQVIESLEKEYKAALKQVNESAGKLSKVKLNEIY
jgi:nitronate monooxygenase